MEINKESGSVTAGRKKRISLLAGMMVLSVFAAACSQGSTTTSDPNKSAAPKEPVELLFYSDAGWTQEAFNERFGDAMRNKFPNYKIEYIVSGKGTTFPELIAAGKTIDVYWQANDVAIGRMQEYNLQYDMTDLIKKHNVNLAQLEQTSISFIKSASDNKMYALPLVNNTAILYYNKDIFDKFGMSYPKDGMTFDETIDLAKKLHRNDGGQQYYGLGVGYNHYVNLNPLSVAYVDQKTDKPTILTDSRWKTIYDAMMAAFQTTDNKSVYATEFVRDKNLGMVNALANLFLNLDMTTMNWDMVTSPVYKEAPKQGPQLYPTLFGITSVSKHKDEAMEILKYMLSEEVQKSLSERGIIPILQNDSVKNAFGTKSKYTNKNFQAILKQNSAPIHYVSKYDAKAVPIYSKEFATMYSNGVDFNTAARKTEEEMNKLIAQEKAK